MSDAVAKGATLLTGGQRSLDRPTKLYYQPTVLTGRPRNVQAFSEEAFGPVAMLVPFDRDDEAVELVNAHAHDLGLVAGIVG
jgi:acyl-CoA reductase-like NAD-dependent aldehyde dehydrogenase